MRSTLSWSFVALALAISGCGYTIRSSENSPLAALGIRRIYVEPLANNTYRAGVDALATNALLKTLAREGGLRVVKSRESADAVLSGSVTLAAYQKGAVVTSTQLRTKSQEVNGFNLIRDDVRVATTYTAQLGVSMILERTREISPKVPKRVWAADFSKSKPYSGSTQLGTLGDTSALINDSEFDQALIDLADAVSADVYQSMTAMF